MSAANGVRPAVAIRLDETSDGPEATLRDYTAVVGTADQIAARVKHLVLRNLMDNDVASLLDQGLVAHAAMRIAANLCAAALGITTEAHNG